MKTGNKTKQSGMRHLVKLFLILYLGTILGIAIFIGVYLFANKISENVKRPLPYGSNIKSFDKKIWLENKYDESAELHPRQEMLQDVVNVLPGKNKQQIITMLGQHSEYGYKEFYFSGSDHDLIYQLGDERGFLRIDSEWLLIWLDENGKFEKYEIATD